MYYYNNCNIIILYLYISFKYLSLYPKPENCQITYTYILPCSGGVQPIIIL